MKHARWDYQAIQPWPTKRPHIARDAAEPSQVFDDWAEHEASMVEPLIPDDEPVMLFRAHDALMPDLLDFYVVLLRRAGASDEIVEAVEGHRLLALDWQEKHGAKIPDLTRIEDAA